METVFCGQFLLAFEGGDDRISDDHKRAAWPEPPNLGREDGRPAAETAPAVARSDWQFTPIVAAEVDPERVESAARSGRGAASRFWFLASPGGIRNVAAACDGGLSGAAPPDAVALARRESPWDAAYRLLEEENGLLTRLRPWAAANALELVELEPALLWVDRRYRRWFERRGRRRARDGSASLTPQQDSSASSRCSRATVRQPRSDRWPPPPKQTAAWDWHLEPTYLGEARKVSDRPSNDVWLAHIDTGVRPGGHIALPRNLRQDQSLNFLDPDGRWPGPTCHPPENGVARHGTGTIGILAGGCIHLDGRSSDVGGAPNEHTVCYRVSNWVIPWPWRLAAAIDKADETERDVISASLGTLPSGCLRDAVNDAYEGGTAQVFAAGNYIRLLRLFPVTPRRMAFPASYRRAIAVVGRTHADKWYTKRDATLRPKCGPQLFGSRGPLRRMSSAVAAYTPNVIWPHNAKDADGKVDLDGAGTSSATPQVAAAAALWLRRWDGDSRLAKRGTWQRTEQVYRALLDSVDRNPKEEVLFGGQGVLNSRTLLATPPETITGGRRRPAGFQYQWVHDRAARLGLPPRYEDLRRRMMRMEVGQIVSQRERLQRHEDRLLADGRLTVRDEERLLRHVCRTKLASRELKQRLRGL